MVDFKGGTLLDQVSKPTEQEREAALERIKALPYGPLVLHAGANKLEEAAASIVAKIMTGEAPKGLVDNADVAINNLVVASNGLRAMAGPLPGEEAGGEQTQGAVDEKAVTP